MNLSKKFGAGFWKKFNTGLMVFMSVQFVVMLNLDMLPNDEDVPRGFPVPVEIPGIIPAQELHRASSVALQAPVPLTEKIYLPQPTALPEIKRESTREVTLDLSKNYQPAEIAAQVDKVMRKDQRAHKSAKAKKSAKEVKQARAEKPSKRVKSKKTQMVAKAATKPAKTRKPTHYLVAVKVPQDTHRSVTLTRQNSMSALERAASRAADESYQENSQRRQARRDANALSTAHVSGTFEEE